MEAASEKEKEFLFLPTNLTAFALSIHSFVSLPLFFLPSLALRRSDVGAGLLALVEAEDINVTIGRQGLGQMVEVLRGGREGGREGGIRRKGGGFQLRKEEKIKGSDTGDI